jgi:hypothetical protein
VHARQDAGVRPAGFAGRSLVGQPNAASARILRSAPLNACRCGLAAPKRRCSLRCWPRSTAATSTTSWPLRRRCWSSTSHARPSTAGSSGVADYAKVKRDVFAAVEVAMWSDLSAHSQGPIGDALTLLLDAGKARGLAACGRRRSRRRAPHRLPVANHSARGRATRSPPTHHRPERATAPHVIAPPTHSTGSRRSTNAN